MSVEIVITKQDFELVVKSLELYNKVLDQIIPWNSFQETVKGLDRYLKNYSLEAAQIIGEIKTLAYNSADNYFSTTQSIREWCGLTSRLLKAYLQLFNKHDENNFPAQKQLLKKVLDDGMGKMTTAHTNLESISAGFNIMTGKLTELLAQLVIDFDNKSNYVKTVNSRIRQNAYGTAAAGVVLGPFGLLLSYSVAAGVVEGQMIPEVQRKLVEVKNFFETLKTQIEKASTDIKNAKSNLDVELENIRVQSGSAQQSPVLDMNHLHDDIIGSVNNIVAQCDEYQKRNSKID